MIDKSDVPTLKVSNKLMMNVARLQRASDLFAAFLAILARLYCLSSSMTGQKHRFSHSFRETQKSAAMPQKKNNSNNSEKLQNAYFLSLELENVRCFGERQKIDFSDDNGRPRQWTIILGNNGTGKTTLLQSLVAMTPYLDSIKFEEDEEDEFSIPVIELVAHITNLWKPFRNDSETPSHIEADFIAQNSLKLSRAFENFTLGASNQSSRFYKKDYWSNTTVSEILATVKCFGYGALRQAGETSISEQNEDSAYISLFDETALLINPEEWLLQADYAIRRESEFQEKRKQQLEIVKNILIKILPDVDDIRFSEKERDSKRIPTPIVEFHTPYGWVEAKDLSLGYRTSMAWMVDFASRMFDLYPESENPLAEPAVVLIDEIDLHLHPKWQRELIDYLTNLFPNTQFIVTTHSPLIVQAAAARDANIVVCRREGDHVVIDQSVEAVRGWRADQILTSDLFDLPSTRDTRIEKVEKQRREILSKAKLTKADEKKLKKLSTELNSLRVMENPEDDKAMDIIRRAAAHLQNGES